MKGEHNILKRIIIGISFLLVFAGMAIYFYIGWKPTTPNNVEQSTEIQDNNTDTPSDTTPDDTPTPSTTYTITITPNSENGSVTGSGEYNEHSNPILTATANEGYKFIGWYIGGELVSNATSYEVTNLSSNQDITARFEKLYTIEYVLDYTTTNTNPTSYTIADENITLIDLEKTGYTFSGWYTGSSGTGTKKSIIDTTSAENITLYSHFTIDTYQISYNLNGGTLLSSNPTEYTIETPNFTLNNPNKADYVFVGWTGNGITTPTTSMTINQGTYGNLEFTAVYEALVNTVNFYADGVILSNNTIDLPRSDTLSAPTINASEYGMTGYLIETWYTDNTYTTEYEFGNTINADTNIYGKWTYFIDYGFYDYYEKFATATTGSILSINSYRELVAWVDWVNFYNITSTYRLKLNYADSSYTQATVLTQLNNAKNDSMFPRKWSDLSPEALSNNTGYIRYGSTHSECTKVADPTHAYAYSQLSSAFTEQTDSPRNALYDGFNINNVSKTIYVETSDQLFYALETGFKPICMASSPAETVYNAAKNVLKEICNDSMTDIQKTYAIYVWLINEVYYDYYAAGDEFNNNTDNLWPEYDSWYADGALLNNQAVCDGISKTFVILAEIENIPAIRVTGNAHAWNRVYLNGAWYGVDATHGGGGIEESEQEIFTLRQFLFTDSYKSNLSYSTTDFSTLTANSTYDIYEDFELYINTDLDFDLRIDNQTEYNKLCEYLYLNYYDGSNFTINLYEIEINCPLSISTLVSDGDNYIYHKYHTHIFSSINGFNETSVSNLTVYTIIL